ncbi:hypothetical protein [Vibrio harveyi]|uniref:hypothetical protein n=1 Tax=Vibrio harveyi TaxID=669 RepID=UPI0008416EAF|nr:hypothetical protein [Vibrio harveyi]ODM57005.1 hypothetical protein BC455_18095 [Vibrio harveyi]
MLRYWLRFINPFVHAQGEHLSENAKKSALDVLEQHGFEAHFYMAGIGHREDKDLSNALDLLSSSGYIITNQDGELVGKVAKARVSTDERAKERRATFRIIK